MLVNSIDLARDPGGALARLGIVFQQPTLNLDLSVAHNLEYFGALHGLSASDTMRRSSELLELLALPSPARQCCHDAA